MGRRCLARPDPREARRVGSLKRARNSARDSSGSSKATLSFAPTAARAPTLRKSTKLFRNWHTLTHFELFRLIGGGTHERDVSAFLNRAAELEVQYGRMLWDRDLVAQDLEAERTGRILPRASNSPRLFISYRWSFDDFI